MFGNNNNNKGFGGNQTPGVNNIFDKIQQQSNVNKDTIMNIATSLQSANFKDEKVVRNLVRQLSALAGKPLTKDKEDSIVKLVVNNNMPIDFNVLSNMINKK